MSLELDTHELAWAAGFFDGEGSSSSSGKFMRKDGTAWKNLVAQLGQCESEKDTLPEVLARFHKVVGGIGHCTGPYASSNPNARPSWRWSAIGLTNFDNVMKLLWPYLGTVKKEQANRTRETFTSQVPSTYVKLDCNGGHGWKNTGIHKNGSRYCKDCSHEAVKKWVENNPEKRAEITRRYNAKRRALQLEGK